MSRGARYSTFNAPNRSSWPAGEVAQRLASSWLLECCCTPCFYKRRTRPSFSDTSNNRANSPANNRANRLPEEEKKLHEKDSENENDDDDACDGKHRNSGPDNMSKTPPNNPAMGGVRNRRTWSEIARKNDGHLIESSDAKIKSSTTSLLSHSKKRGSTLSIIYDCDEEMSSLKTSTPISDFIRIAHTLPNVRKRKDSQNAERKPLDELETLRILDIFPKCGSVKKVSPDSVESDHNDGSSLSEACSTPIIGAGSRASSSHTVMDMDDMESSLHAGHLATRASLSSLGARSDSMASVYSGAGEGRCCRSVVVTGEVEFALQYDYKHLTFEVHVTKCKNLAPVDVKRKRSDPYVKVYLLPDKSKSGKRKTKVKKHTLNPEFNETLKFHMSLSGLETRTLWLTVWHSDMFGRNDFLGEVRMPLENKIFDDPTPRWYPLQERTEPFDDPIAYKGEVIVGLKFVPPDPAQQQEREREMGSDSRSSKVRKNWSRGALHVLVKEARNLQTRAKNSGTCDPFCKSYLLPDKGRSGKQKTGVVRRSGGSPVWGHTFIYKDVSLQELAERGLELTVWDHDRIASNEFLGGVRFNLGTGKHYGKPVDWMDATGRELSLWQSMLERPNFWVEGAVTLRPNLHNHGKTSGP